MLQRAFSSTAKLFQRFFRRGLKRGQIVSPSSVSFLPPPPSPSLPSISPLLLLLLPPLPLRCLWMLWDELIQTRGLEGFWLLVLEPFSSCGSLPHRLLLKQTERGGGDGSSLICWLLGSAPASRPSAQVAAAGRGQEAAERLRSGWLRSGAPARQRGGHPGGSGDG